MHQEPFTVTPLPPLSFDTPGLHWFQKRPRDSGHNANFLLPLPNTRKKSHPHDNELTPFTDLVGERLETGSHWVPAAKPGRLEPSNDVLEGGSHHKVLLFQPKLLPLKELQDSIVVAPTTNARLQD